MRLLLVRHAETEWNQIGRIQGRLDVPLSEAGREQARRLGQRLATQPVARAVASSLGRARETAELALGPRAAMLTLEDDLAELHHGAWQGLLFAEIAERHPEDLRVWREHPEVGRPTGGEGLEAALARTWPVLVRACEGLQGEDTLLLVTHDGVIRSLLSRVLGLPLARAWSYRLASTSLTLLEGDHPDNLTLVRLNDASHLHPLFGEPVHRRVG